MPFILQPIHLVLMILAGWINEEQQRAIEHLRTENQILRTSLPRAPVLHAAAITLRQFRDQLAGFVWPMAIGSQTFNLDFGGRGSVWVKANVAKPFRRGENALVLVVVLRRAAGGEPYSHR
jgi:hypothetical protein